MSSENQPILGVPTNIITGFLGGGKDLSDFEFDGEQARGRALGSISE